MPRLEVIDKQLRTLQSRDFGEGGLIIGRGEGVGLRIAQDGLLSRRHCAILRHEGRWILRDLGSRNGTIAGKQRIDAVLIRDGALFRIGNTFLRFRNPDEAASVDSESAPDAAPAASDDDPVYDVAEVVAEEPGGGSSDRTNSLRVAERVGNAYGAESIQSLSVIGDDPGFGLSDISLVNSRGEVVHAAGRDAGGQAEQLLVLQLLLLGAARCRTTDMHVEPKQGGGLLRMRIDGAMIEVCPISTELQRRLSSLVKVLSDIDISQKAQIQDGRFSSRVPGRQIDYRVSFTPSMHGQKLVVRVLDQASAPQTLPSLGLPDDILDRIESCSEQNTGLLTICGPTGSGKTTTLYAMLRGIDASLRNVITIEDPIEYELANVTQIPVDQQRRHGFAELLRSCLRQDPDVIVLGEVRDAATATASMQAATTGHLVLATMHATDTLGVVYRLLDLGAEPALVASTLNLVLAQRLVRVLCERCKVPAELSLKDRRRLGLAPDEEPPGQVMQPTGCPACFETGYAGRAGVFELLIANDAIRDIIINSANISQLRQAAQDSGLVTLREAALRMIYEGRTSISEAQRVVGLD